MNILPRIALAILLMYGFVAAGCRTNVPPERQVSDATITSTVKSKLASDVRLSTITNVDVTTVNSVVTLAGQVNSEEEKRMAEATARNVHGVKQVYNNLQVVPPPAGG